MPETNIEKDFRRIANIGWETCSDICNKDELCDSFNYGVLKKAKKIVNVHVKNLGKFYKMVEKLLLI